MKTDFHEIEANQHSGWGNRRRQSCCNIFARLCRFDALCYLVAEGEKIPRKGGPEISRSDLLIINKKDLAPYVHVDLDVMKYDAEIQRKNKPFVFTDLLRREGLNEIIRFIEKSGGFN